MIFWNSLTSAPSTQTFLKRVRENHLHKMCWNNCVKCFWRRGPREAPFCLRESWRSEHLSMGLAPSCSCFHTAICSPAPCRSILPTTPPWRITKSSLRNCSRFPLTHQGQGSLVGTEALRASPSWSRHTVHPHVVKSALANGDSIQYIPDGMESPASVLAHIIAIVNLRPPNTVVQRTNCEVIYGSPI